MYKTVFSPLLCSSQENLALKSCETHKIQHGLITTQQSVRSQLTHTHKSVGAKCYVQANSETTPFKHRKKYMQAHLNTYRQETSIYFFHPNTHKLTKPYQPTIMCLKESNHHDFHKTQSILTPT